MSRRATDLAVLLNNDASPSRRPSLHDLLHDDNDNKLGASQPLRRTYTAVRVEDDDEDDDDIEELPAFTSSPSTHLRTLAAAPPRTASPSVGSRPSSSSSSRPFDTPTPRTTVSPTMPPPSSLPSAIPYNPKFRKTPASSVLVPLSSEEIQMYKSYQGQGAARLTKRKRPPSNDPPDDRRPAKRLAGDVGVVVQHYNSRPEVGVVQRQDSPIIGLKNFNNWVKSVLIARFAHPALAADSNPNPRMGKGKVLDMGCGKGGDLTKWAKARIGELVGADIAAVSVDQARDRWESMRGHRFQASFAAIDCYSEPLTSAFPPSVFTRPFDVVSLQFCMHYAFETEAKARRMLSNVTQWLRPGGIFIGTIPNSEQLLEHLDAVPQDAKHLSFGNAVYRISFDDRSRPLYGHRYWFFLKDAVEDVPEYIVQWDNFVELAAEYQLHVVYKEEFHQVFAEHQNHPDFGPLMVKMKVVDANGESAMDEDQWEAANIYIAFAFEKR